MGNIHLAKRLSAENEVHIVDAYGFSKLYLQAIKDAGLPCHVVMPNCKKVYIGNKGAARLISFLKQLPVLLRLQSRLIRKVLEINPDAVWVSGPKSFVFLATSFRLRKYPLAMYFRGWGTPDQVNQSLLWLLKYRASAIMAVSKATAEQFRLAGVPAQKLHAVLNTIDMEMVRCKAKEPLEKSVPGLDKYPKLLLPSPRPTREKGHITAIKALAHLKKAGFDPILWLPGEVAEGGDSSFPNQLKRLACELSVQESVYLLGWINNMSALIKACAIVILPTHTEGLPRVILEAMLLQRPVVATPVGGICEVITDGRTGLLFPVDDDKALAAKVHSLISDSNRTAEIIDRAYELVTTEYTPELHTKRVSDAFRSVIKNK